jgi:hypothetical protein
MPTNKRTKRFGLRFAVKKSSSLPESSSSGGYGEVIETGQGSLTQPVNVVRLVVEYGDRQRVLERYAAATKLLQDAIKRHDSIWKSLDNVEFYSGFEEFDSQLRSKINKVLELRNPKGESERTWTKFRHALDSFFTIFSPFAKNFLTIAQTSSQVHRHKIFGADSL